MPPPAGGSLAPCGRPCFTGLGAIFSLRYLLTAKLPASWTENQTLFLLDTYKNYKEEMENPRYKKAFVWEKIATDLRAHGINVTANQVNCPSNTNLVYTCNHVFSCVCYQYNWSKINNGIHVEAARQTKNKIHVCFICIYSCNPVRFLLNNVK